MRGRLCKSLLSNNKLLKSSSKILRGLRDLQRGRYRKEGKEKIAADMEIKMTRIESIERQAEKDGEVKLAQIEGDKDAK